MTTTTTETTRAPLTQSYRLDGVFTALSSITHFGDSVGGIEQVLRREKIIQPPGSDPVMLEIPVISGNSWRGQLRDAGMRAMLDELAVALGIERVTLPAPAFHMLFSGGALTKGADGSHADIGEARRLRTLVPLLGVLGSAVGRQILEGKLTVGKILPICAETAHLLPEAQRETHPFTRVSIYEFLGMEHYTRMDDAKRESLAGRYLPAAEQVLLEAPKVRTQVNKRTGEVEELAAPSGVATQMRYGWETYAAGTQFTCRLHLRHVTPLEFEAFMAALREWSREPTLGGRASIGMGQVKLELSDWFSADPLARVDATGIASSAVSTEPFGVAYRQHLHTHAGEIVAALEALA